VQSLPKIIHAKSYPNRFIEIQFANGVVGKFNFEDFFEYRGYYDFLKDVSSFLKILVESQGHFVFWTNNETGEDIELDPYIMYSICTNEKIIHDNKVVFDPSLGKNAWMRKSS
jgi:hypothetical protein